MDMKKFAESEYVTIDDVKTSETKTIVFINSGEEKNTDFGHKLKFMVEMDGKQKFFTPNKTSVQNLILGFGEDSNKLIGQVVKLDVEVIKGRESIIVHPIVSKKDKE